MNSIGVWGDLVTCSVAVDVQISLIIDERRLAEWRDKIRCLECVTLQWVLINISALGICVLEVERYIEVEPLSRLFKRV